MAVGTESIGDCAAIRYCAGQVSFQPACREREHGCQVQKARYSTPYATPQKKKIQGVACADEARVTTFSCQHTARDTSRRTLLAVCHAILKDVSAVVVASRRGQDAITATGDGGALQAEQRVFFSLPSIATAERYSRLCGRAGARAPARRSRASQAHARIYAAMIFRAASSSDRY